MMKNLFRLMLLVAVLATAQGLNAQSSYQSAIGLRLGYPTSVSYKFFLSDPAALELFAGFRGYSGYGWFNVGAAYQVHKPIEGVENLQWYFGGGASAFFFNYDNDFDFGDEGSVSFGLLGNLGLDYKIPSAPINLSLDWMPIFFINGYGSGFSGGYGALSVRYTLK